jgi:hypothetical protein
VVRLQAPHALICLNAFPIVKWAGKHLDELGRRLASGCRAAGLIKEQLREALRVKGGHGKALLAGVISWAVRSRIPGFALLTG